MAPKENESELEPQGTQTHLRFRFWLEMTAASCSTVLVLITLIWKDWIETVFRVDLDNGTGSLERFICTVLLTMAVTLFVTARCEWRRIQKSEY
jgi:hypothetical protein